VEEAMKVCPICQSTYDATVDFCFKDGAPLELQTDGDPSEEVKEPDFAGLTEEELEPPDAVSLTGLIPIATAEDDLATLSLAADVPPPLEEDELATVTSGVQSIAKSDERADDDAVDPFEKPEAAEFRERITRSQSVLQLGPEGDADGDGDSSDRMETVQWEGLPAGFEGANDGSKGFFKLVLGLCVAVGLILAYQIVAVDTSEDGGAGEQQASVESEPDSSDGQAGQEPASDSPGAEVDSEDPAAGDEVPDDAAVGDEVPDDAAVGDDAVEDPEGPAEVGEAAAGGQVDRAPAPESDEAGEADGAAQDDGVAAADLDPPPPPSSEVSADDERDRLRVETREERREKQDEQRKTRAEARKKQRDKEREDSRAAARDKAASAKRAERVAEKQSPSLASDAGNPWTSGAASPSPQPAATSGGDPSNPWGVSSPASEPAKVTRAKVTISTKPSGARVKVAGKSRGTSPVKAELPVGTHEIQVSKDGYVPRSSYLKVADGEPVSISIALEPLVAPTAKREGTLFISSSPSGALLYVDGSSRGRTPISVTVTEGTHSLKLVAEGRSPVQKRIRVDFARSTTVRRFIEIP
jgi:hypothetical protein